MGPSQIFSSWTSASSPLPADAEAPGSVEAPGEPAAPDGAGEVPPPQATTMRLNAPNAVMNLLRK